MSYKDDDPSLDAMERVSDAAHEFVGMIARMGGDFGFGAFTCMEIESLADLCRACGDDATAETIIAEHARGDDEGDQHFGMAPDDMEEYGDGLN